MCLFLLKFSVHESILVVQGCKSHPVLVDARRIYRFHKQGKAIFIVLFKVLLSVFASNFEEMHGHFPCPDVMHSFILIRKEKIDSENELNITRVYGAA
jgi:predicted SAM-dependent methyltransferase